MNSLTPLFVTFLVINVALCKKQSKEGTLDDFSAAVTKSKGLTKIAIADLLQKLKNVNFKASKISPKCRSRVKELIKKKDYKVLIGYADSIGKPGSGLFLGNYYWPGSFSECHQIADSHYCLAGFQAHFALGNKTIIYSPGVLGTCMPKECNADDVHLILQQLPNYVPSIRKYLSFPTYGALSKYGRSNVACEKEQKEFETGTVATLVVCSILVLLCLAGTFCELFQSLMFQSSTLNQQDEQEHLPKDEEEEFRGSDTLPILDTNSYGMPQFSQYHPPYMVKGLIEFLVCFSLIKNTNAILSTDVPKGAILSINGIRTLSILWIILGHVYSIGNTAGGLENVTDLLKLLNRFSFVPIANGFFSVDSFFLLSGLLMSYLSLRRFDKTGKMPVFMAYLHRFLRLTPAYMFMILFCVNILPLLGDGPLWSCVTSKLLEKPCLDYWWTNLLYINNLYPNKLEDECIGWSWYLANDMQFFIISPFILFIMHKLKLIGTLCVNGVLIAISMLITSIIIGVYNLESLTIVADIALRRVSKHSYQDLVYIKPYCRIVPYLVGIVLGYILHRQMRYKGSSKWIFALAGWSVAIICSSAVTYGTWGSVKHEGHVFTKAENVIYGSFSRLSWSLAVAWVIYACHFDLGSLINSILSWRGFIPLSRLTYSVYLIHPMTIMLFYGTLYSPYSYTDFHGAFQFVSIAVMSYAAAFILAIFVEYPVLNLEKKLFRNV